MRRTTRITIALGAISLIVGGAGVVRAATSGDGDTPITGAGLPGPVPRPSPPPAKVA